MGFALIAGLLVTSCTKEEDENEFHGIDSKGAVVIITNVVNGFFDLANPAASEIAFDVDTKGETVSSILVTKSINGGAEVDHATISAPSTVNVTFNDALSGTGVSAGDLEPGDAAVLNFYLTTSSGTYKGGSLNVDMSCVSDLAGVFEYSTIPWCDGSVTETGMTEWVSAGAGVYDVVNPDDPENPDAADFAYGAYFPCYGATATLPGGDLQVLDICGKIAPIGVSRWGEVYWFNGVSVDGTKLTIDWENDYGESGVTTLTRTDGKDWPPLTN